MEKKVQFIYKPFTDKNLIVSQKSRKAETLHAQLEQNMIKKTGQCKYN